MQDPVLHRIAEGAIQVSWPASIDLNIHQQVMALDRSIQQDPFPGWIENVPAYHTLTIYFDPALAPKDIEQFLIRSSIQSSTFSTRTIRVPVCYDPAVAMDLDVVCSLVNRSREEVVELHTSTLYSVFMIGFLPGFPYMGILPEALALPRKSTPSPKIPEGAVAIAGRQTGIYPVDSPGGWYVIGATPWPMFRDGHTLLQPGDQVQFYSIELEAYHLLKKQFLEEWPSI